MRPELPVSRQGRTALWGLTLLSGVKAVGWVLLATGLARGIAHLAATLPAPESANLIGLLFRPDPAAFDPARFGMEQWAGQADTVVTLTLGALGVLARAVAVWGQQVLARRAALGAQQEIRLALVRHRLDSAGAQSERSGTDAVLASVGLEGLDDWFTQYLPALVSAMVVPLALGVWILAHDWVSALILVLTIPLIPLFMILIGRYTEDRVEQAADGLDRLSQHLLELARGLPVLVGLRRAGTQRQALAEVSERYRATTMTTLRTAFMSGFALELISTLSVAVVAVFIGVRLVYGDLDLYTGLLILVLAPEVYLPFRDVGSAHHASEDGLEALRRARAEADRPVPAALADRENTPGTDDVATASAARPGEDRILWRGVGIAYRGPEGEPGPMVIGGDGDAGLELDLTPGLTVLAGASGTGKSSLTHALAGVLRSEAAQFSGQVTGLAGRPVAWLGQHPSFSEASVQDELHLHAHAAGATTDQVGPILDSALSASGLTGTLARHPDDLSPGERRRLGVARVLVRLMAAARQTAQSVEQSNQRAWLVVLDEPTAHLDRDSAERVRHAIGELGHGRLPNGTELPMIVVVASHDRLLHTCADTLLDAQLQPTTAAPAPTVAVPQPTAPAESTDRTPTAPEPSTDQHTDQHTEQPLTWRQMLSLLPLRNRRFLSGVAWSVAATLAAALLSALSGWLIVQASYQPPVLYLLSVIVLVRFFGIGRALFRYLDRLATHDAVLGWANEIRLRLWDALGSRVALWGRLTRSGGALSLLVSDVDELRDAVPRVIVPLPAAIISWAVTLGIVAVMAPDAWWPAALAGLLGFTLIPAVVTWVDRRTTGELAGHRTGMLRRTSALFSAAADLSANDAAGIATERFAAQDDLAIRPLRRAAVAAGAGQALVVLVSGGAAVISLVVCIQHGVIAPITALVVFLMLALAEPLSLCVTATQEMAILRRQLQRTGPYLLADHAPDTTHDDVAATDTTPGSWVQVGPGDGLELRQVSARYPESTSDVFTTVDLTGQRGQRTVVTGPSGSGKSTLLAVLLGFLQPRTGQYRLQVPDPDHTSAATALQRVTWCPQDAALFDSTLRANLALARTPDDRPSDEEMLQVLHTVGLGPWLATSHRGLDTRVGPAGHSLSGGQRQRVAVARALLARADVVLLDEPTAHLGQDEAEELVTDLRRALAETTAVLVTHDTRFVERGEHHLDLAVAHQHTHQRSVRR